MLSILCLAEANVLVVMTLDPAKIYCSCIDWRTLGWELPAKPYQHAPSMSTPFFSNSVPVAPSKSIVLFLLIKFEVNFIKTIINY